MGYLALKRKGWDSLSLYKNKGIKKGKEDYWPLASNTKSYISNVLTCWKCKEENRANDCPHFPRKNFFVVEKWVTYPSNVNNRRI